LLALLAGDGRPLLAATGAALALAGAFAVFVSCRKEFLPHDTAFLGMTPDRLCGVNECRVVHFMIHDRVSFGGALVAIGVMYLWLTAGPLTAGERWAWRLLTVSGAVGFASFLAYLGYGYLDTWHGAATAALLPLFATGLWLARPRGPGPAWDWTIPRDPGRIVLLIVACGMIGGGLTILTVGMTTVFVPEDVAFMGIGRAELGAINPRLVPLIAHDRAGFGGAVCCCGILLGGVAWCAAMTWALREALVLAGAAGFGTAILVHPAIGYTDWWHLTPAVGGAVLYSSGLFWVRGAASESERATGRTSKTAFQPEE
jgi:hypothetical protein